MSNYLSTIFQYPPTMMITSLIIPLIIIIILLIKPARKKTPPGPPGLPFIGNLLQFDKANPHMYLHRLSKKYGPLVHLRHGSTPILVVSSSRTAKHILKTHDLSFCSRPPIVGQQKLAYNGIDMAFSPYSQHWRQMRKICVLHLLSTKQVYSGRAGREDEVQKLTSKISRSIGSSCNLSDMTMSLASNLICREAFGRRYDDDEYEKMRFDRLIMEAQALMVSFYCADHFPGLGWVDKVLGLTGRLDRNCKELDVFYQRLIDEHLDPGRARPEKPDIIDLMIELKYKNESSLSMDLTWDHIKALLMDLLVAGTDTVAAALVWSMTALMLRPEIMKQAQAQIRQLVGPKGFVDEDDIKKLPYLKAVVLEALRLYPPAPLLFRTQILKLREYIDVDGYQIEPGTSVFINGWAMARDPETWTDPDEFRPERFTSNLDILKGGGFEMVPFGGGRRGCPGMEMGLISTELALANLLYSFDWALPDDRAFIDTEALPGLTMHKKNPLVLVATKYN
ncbi:hypothetical protein CASFOL_041007 [Castilleja foliolosa]|uniref:Cytochrome P450 n=1 Tax=Castilleja foliolosa TaxID=1961234 RepID=A0ABD3BE75_9LAMI